MPATVPHTGPYDSDFDDPLFDADLDTYEPDSEERTLATIAHLLGFAGLVLPLGSVIGPLVMYLTKRDSSAFVEDQAREALNFQIWILIAGAVSFVLLFVGLGFVLLPIVGLSWLAGTLVGAIRANEGVRFRYPFTIRLVK